MTFRKILLAYDFSDPSNRALLFAAKLATQLGSELHLVHVQVDIYDGRSAPEAGIPWPSQDQTDRYMRFLHGELHNAARTVVQELSDKLTYHVLRGDPVKRIEALAEELGADLICIGSTGKGAVQRMLLGSVAQAVLRSSKVPVLSVH
jgi:nucleotide-binding universal stress UspA family protein